MKKVKILKIDNYIYTLIDDDNNKYNLNFEFIDLNKNISVNDDMYINEELLNEKEFYTFGVLSSEFGKEIESELDDDILIIESKEGRVYLKRLYG